MQKKIKYCVLAGWSPANGDASPSLHGTQTTLAGVATNLIREATEAGTRLPKFQVGGKNLDFIICWFFLKQRAKLNTCSLSVILSRKMLFQQKLSRAARTSVSSAPSGDHRLAPAGGGHGKLLSRPRSRETSIFLPRGAPPPGAGRLGVQARPRCAQAPADSPPVSAASVQVPPQEGEAAPSSSPRHCAKL